MRSAKDSPPPPPESAKMSSGAAAPPIATTITTQPGHVAVDINGLQLQTSTSGLVALKDLERVIIKQGKTTLDDMHTRRYEILDESGQLIYKAELITMRTGHRTPHIIGVTLYDQERKVVATSEGTVTDQVIWTPSEREDEEAWNQIAIVEMECCNGWTLASHPTQVDTRPFRFILDSDCCFCCPVSSCRCCCCKCFCYVCGSCAITTFQIKPDPAAGAGAGPPIGEIKILRNRGTETGARTKVTFPAAEIGVKEKTALLMTGLVLNCFYFQHYGFPFCGRCGAQEGKFNLLFIYFAVIPAVVILVILGAVGVFN